MRRLWRWLFGPRQRHVDPLQLVSNDWCCICLVDLFEGQVYEQRDHLVDTIDDHEGGGSWVVRTYCAEHAPPDALTPVPFTR